MLVTNDINLINKSLIHNLKSINFNSFLLELHGIIDKSKPPEREKIFRADDAIEGTSSKLTKSNHVSKCDHETNVLHPHNLIYTVNVKKFLTKMVIFYDR